MAAASMLHDVELGTLDREEIPLAASLSARAMRDNPISIALFGDDPVRRVHSLEPIFHWVLTRMERSPLVVRRHGYIIGLAAVSPPEQCFFRQTAGREKSLLVAGKRVSITIPYIPRQLLLPLLRLGRTGLTRVSIWGESGLKRDPGEPHQHVELVVVEAGLQGLGIGRMLMEALCKEIDRLDVGSYLETDTWSNVQFYEHYDFQVQDEATVIGTRNWYMVRPAPSNRRT